jgi:hypothetical protein
MARKKYSEHVGSKRQPAPGPLIQLSTGETAI